MPVVLITGGASLIAEGIARSLIADGWTAVLADIDLDGARKAAETLGEAASAIALDVTDQTAVIAAVAGVVVDHGSIDGLVNAAGGLRNLGIERRDFKDSTPAEWDRIIDVNLEGVLNCIHAVLPPMMEAKSGNIVSIAASRGIRGKGGAAVQSGAKAGVIVFCQNLATEIGPYNIRINTLLPGNTEARWKDHNTDPGVRRMSPLGRHTRPEDVGNMVAFLMSDKASHVTGSCFDVSGGTALH